MCHCIHMHIKTNDLSVLTLKIICALAHNLQGSTILCCSFKMDDTCIELGETYNLQISHHLAVLTASESGSASYLVYTALKKNRSIRKAGVFHESGGSAAAWAGRTPRRRPPAAGRSGSAARPPPGCRPAARTAGRPRSAGPPGVRPPAPPTRPPSRCGGGAAARRPEEGMEGCWQGKGHRCCPE